MRCAATRLAWRGRRWQRGRSRGCVSRGRTGQRPEPDVSTSRVAPECWLEYRPGTDDLERRAVSWSAGEVGGACCQASQRESFKGRHVLGRSVNMSQCGGVWRIAEGLPPLSRYAAAGGRSRATAGCQAYGFFLCNRGPQMCPIRSQFIGVGGEQSAARCCNAGGLCGRTGRPVARSGAGAEMREAFERPPALHQFRRSRDTGYAGSMFSGQPRACMKRTARNGAKEAELVV